MKNFVIIVAGGTGTRMGANCPKQFLELKGKPIIIHSIQKFLAAKNLNLNVILVVHSDFLTFTKELCAQWLSKTENESLKITTGGKSRFESVQNGVNLISDQNGYVAIHDAVRPLLSVALINRMFELVASQKCLVPAIAVTDSIRQFTNDAQSESKALIRDHLVGVQTPQCFSLEIIKEAYKQKNQPHFTDSASVVEFLGYKVNIVEGENSNIKITRPLDLQLAEILLSDV